MLTELGLGGGWAVMGISTGQITSALSTCSRTSSPYHEPAVSTDPIRLHGTQTTPTASWWWRSQVVLLKCNLLVRCCIAGHPHEWHFWCEASWPASEVTYGRSGCSSVQQLHFSCKQGDARPLRSFRSGNAIFSKWIFLPRSPSASNKWTSSGQNMQLQWNKVSGLIIFGNRTMAWLCQQCFKCSTFFLFLGGGRRYSTDGFHIMWQRMF